MNFLLETIVSFSPKPLSSLGGGTALGPGEGLTWRLQYEWGWSLGATMLLLLILEGLFVMLYLRERRRASFLTHFALAQLRFLSLAVVFFMSSKAALSFFRTGLPYLPVIVDDSLSMTAVDSYGSASEELLRAKLVISEGEAISRWGVVQRLFAQGSGQWWQRLRRGYRPRLHLLSRLGAGNGLSEVDPFQLIATTQPSAPSTELGGAIRQILDSYAGMPPAAIVLVTDGINTDGPGLEEAARWSLARQVPLFFVVVGEETSAPDVELRDLTVEDALFIGDLAVFSCTVAARGLKGQKLVVALREGGSQQVLHSVEVVPSEDRFQRTVQLSYRPGRVGKYRFRVEVDPHPQEIDTENNRLERLVTVTDEKVRVLLASVGPSYEFRFLASLLGRERTMEVRTFLQEADLGHADQDPTAIQSFPVRREDLAWFDVIILMDTDPNLLGNVVLENLANYVDPQGTSEKGTAWPEEGARAGNLVIVAGPRHLPRRLSRTPLERILPVQLVSTPEGETVDRTLGWFRPRPTPMGHFFPGLLLADSPAESEALWNRLPPFYWYAVLGSPKAGARVLLEHPNVQGADGRPMPLVVFHYVGQGTVMIHAFDETWRWRWRVGDLFFARYWLQTLRFLARGRLGARDKRPIVSADRREYRFGEPVVIRLQFPEGAALPSDEGVYVLVRTGDQKPQRVNLSRSSRALNIFEGVLTHPQVGQHEVWYPQPGHEDSTVSAQFRVLPPASEFARLEADFQAMRQAAERTGGMVLRPWEVAQLPEVLPQGPSLPIEALPSRPIWNWWPIVLLLVALLSVEWMLRKLMGMA